MERDLKYVSPEYQAQLDHLAETLVTQRRFLGDRALEDTVEFPAVPENIIQGDE